MLQKPDLFRITVDDPNFTELVENGVSDKRRDALPIENRRLKYVGVWGFKKGKHNERLYNDFLASGDSLLFYKGKKNLPNPEQRTEGRYVGMGTVGEKFGLSEAEADTVFGNPAAQLAFTVEEFQPISKTIDEIASVLGYESHPQGPHRVKEDRYETIESVKQAVLE